MPSQSESAYAFYSAGSGLTPARNFSLGEHKFAYLKSYGAPTAWSLDDAEAQVYGQQGEYAYLKAQTSGTGSLDQLRALYYAGGGGGPTVAVYDSSTYDSTAVYA